MNKLPSIYKQDLKTTNTNKEYCYAIKKETLEEEIESIMDSLGPIQKKKVRIETTKGNYITYMSHQDKDAIWTIDNKKIPLEEILSIKRIS